jgi:stringent starvation protein B
MPHPLPPKKEVALALLERSSVHVHLDPRAAGVVVPPWFKRQPQLILQIGLNMPVPIPDLRLDEEGMSCTLSFQRSPFYCVVPWPSVFAMVGEDGRGMVWPDDVPPEIADARAAERAQRDLAQAQAQVRPADGAAREAPASNGRKGRRGRVADVDEAGDRRGAGAGSSKAPAELEARSSRPSKKSRKKPRPQSEEVRPMLVAIPSPEKSGAGTKKKLPAHHPPTSAGPSKPKRELPPYLRVVK